jgi:hypothetical protein
VFQIVSGLFIDLLNAFPASSVQLTVITVFVAFGVIKLNEIFQFGKIVSPLITHQLLAVIEVILPTLSHTDISIPVYVVHCFDGQVETKTRVLGATLSIFVTDTFTLPAFPAASTKFTVSLPFHVYVFVNVVAHVFVHHAIDATALLVVIVTVTSPFVGDVVEYHTLPVIGVLSMLLTDTFTLPAFPAASTKFTVSLPFHVYVFVNVVAHVFVHHAIDATALLVVIVTVTSPFVGDVVEYHTLPVIGVLSMLLTTTVVAFSFHSASLKIGDSVPFALNTFVNCLAFTLVHPAGVFVASSLRFIVTVTSPFVGAVVE